MTKHDSENHGKSEIQTRQLPWKAAQTLPVPDTELAWRQRLLDGESPANAMEQGGKANTLEAMLLQMIEIERYHELGRVYCGQRRTSKDPK